MDYTIYCIENEVNHKLYVGMTSNTVEWRFQKHLEGAKYSEKEFPLYCAIRKHGSENFTIFPLTWASDLEEACKFEREWIQRLGTYEDIGYNATPGGETGTAGEHAGRAVLTNEQVAEIRHRYVTDDSLNSEMLARECDVGKHVIKRAISGRSYPNAEMPDGMQEAKERTTFEAQLRGGDHHSSRLTDAEVLAVRQRYMQEDNFHVRTFADEHDLSRISARRIIKGENYGHLPVPDGMEERHREKHRNYQSENCGRSGENHSQSKLTSEQVYEARRRYAQNDILQSELADEYEMSAASMSELLNGKTYSDVPMPKA